MAKRISDLFRKSVGHLEDQVPESHQLILDTLGPLHVTIDVDGDVFRVSGGGQFTITDQVDGPAGTAITTTRTAILDVLDARIGLTQAVEAGSVVVRGSLEDVLRTHDTLIAYVHASVRAPSQPQLLDALRAGAP